MVSGAEDDWKVLGSGCQVQDSASDLGLSRRQAQAGRVSWAQVAWALLRSACTGRPEPSVNVHRVSVIVPSFL